MHINLLCACWHSEALKGSSSLSSRRSLISLHITSFLFLCPEPTDAPCPYYEDPPPPFPRWRPHSQGPHTLPFQGPRQYQTFFTAANCSWIPHQDHFIWTLYSLSFPNCEYRLWAPGFKSQTSLFYFSSSRGCWSANLNQRCQRQRWYAFSGISDSAYAVSADVSGITDENCRNTHCLVHRWKPFSGVSDSSDSAFAFSETMPEMWEMILCHISGVSNSTHAVSVVS